MKNINIKKITLTALFAALCFVGATIQIVIPVGIGEPKLHLGNLFMMIGAILLGGVYGGAAAGIGMGISDIFTGMYAIYAPGTIIGKFLAAFVCGKIVYAKGYNGRNIAVNFIGCTIGIIVNILCSTLNTIFVKGIINGGELGPVAIATLGNLGVGITNGVIAVVLAVPIAKMLSVVIDKTGTLGGALHE